MIERNHSMTIYYVYAYLRKTNNTVYYIGKGKGGRAYDSINHRIKVPEKSRIIIIERNLTEIGAFALERRLIKWYGRKDLGTGVLRNLTDGGEGTSGYKQSKSHTDKIRKANLGKKVTECVKEKIRQKLVGRKHTADQNTAKSERQRGKKQPWVSATLTGRKNPKISEALSGIPKPIVECPHCGTSGGASAMGRWHFDKCRAHHGIV
jgi:hypothetical protein